MTTATKMMASGQAAGFEGLRPGEVTTGTTIMAVEFDGGVVIGADTRTTAGVYVANRVTDKLTRLTERVYCCNSGSAADTQAIGDIVKYHLDFYKIEMGEEPKVMAVANIFRQWCYHHRDDLTAGIIIAGWDRWSGGQVFSLPMGGMAQRLPFAVGGSGSTYIYGFVDAAYKPGMKKEDCLKFVANGISLAINRDGGSGGLIRMAVITKGGVERITLAGDQLPKFYEDH